MNTHLHTKNKQNDLSKRSPEKVEDSLKKETSSANAFASGWDYNLGDINLSDNNKSGEHSFYVQPKLKINQPGDQYEQEADAMAEKVMRMSDKEVLQPKQSSSLPIQRKCAECEKDEDEKVHRKETNNSAPIVSNAVHQTLQSSGKPLDKTTRSFMEQRFGYDFGKVRIHNDSLAHKSSGDINALAYTRGDHVVFGTGQYRPETVTGKKLMAHELTHILQQSPITVIQRKELSAAEKIEECAKQTTDILPGHVGILTIIDRDVQMTQMFGAELPALKAKIKGDAAARRFICEYGLSGMAALVETQKGGSFDIPAAKLAVDESIKTKSGRFNRSAIGKWRIAGQQQMRTKEAAESIGYWARAEDRTSDDIPTPSAALKMPATQVSDISTMIQNLESMKVNFTNVGSVLSQSQSSIDKIAKTFSAALPSGMLNESYGSNVSTLMDTALADLNTLDRSLFALSSGRMDLSDENTALSALKAAAETIKNKALSEQQKMLHGDAADYSEMRDVIKEARRIPLKNLKESFTLTKQNIENISKNLPKLIFVLQYFRALNDSKGAVPNESEMNTFNGQLDSVDTNLFFGTGPSNPGLEIIQSALKFVRDQVAIRLQMKGASGNLPALIPTLAEVEAFFTTMNNKSTTNEQVRKAYEDFAQAYFQHRGITSLQDLKISGISDVFSLPVSITGSRSIVCGAYAQMGAALMNRAGASNIVFTIAVRASNEQIKNDTLDDGHAIAKVTRQSKVFFVSNYLTNDTEAEAMDVAWEHPDLPLHKATASDYNTATKKLAEELAKIRSSL